MSRAILGRSENVRRTNVDVPVLQRRLLRWYRRHQRKMPWRGISDPYRIWVSEVMLQQTQLATVLPYYQSFIERFPTAEVLANAGEAKVLEAWSGLGYYRRARNLHVAAQWVVRENGGRIPDDPERFRKLPGVGRYTMGAVLSIAFDRPLPVLDGNVARALSRLFALDAAYRDPKGARALWDLATLLVPPRAPGDWNQAVMELGATLCSPRSPRCGECPVESSCRARALGRVGDFPPVMARRRPKVVRIAMVRIERRGKVLMTKRESELLRGLWEPPSVELRGGGAGPQLERELKRLGVRAKLTPARCVLKHLLTHRAFDVRVWRGELLAPLPRSVRLRYIDPRKPGVAVTGLARKVSAIPAF